MLIPPSLPSIHVPVNGATLRSQPTEINDDDNDAYRTPVELTIVSQSVSQSVLHSTSTAVDGTRYSQL